MWQPGYRCFVHKVMVLESFSSALNSTPFSSCISSEQLQDMSVKVTTEVAEVEASKAPLDEQGQVQTHVHRDVAIGGGLRCWCGYWYWCWGWGGHFIVLPMFFLCCSGFSGSPPKHVQIISLLEYSPVPSSFSAAFSVA